MKFGLYAINYGTCGDPESLVRVAQYAESAGLESLWAGEHIVVPSPQPPDYGVAPEIPFLDAIVALALAAAHTTTITVGTGVIELPLHQPVLLAKQLASVDQISRGRLIVGIGVGYLALEFAALGVSLDERASSHRGVPASAARAVDDGRSRVPRPARRLRGRRRQSASGAIRRPADPDRRQQRDRASAARSRAPTVGSRTTSISTPHARPVARSTATCRTTPRPEWLGAFDFTIISPNNRLDPEHVEVYRELGVDRLICLPGLDVPRDRRYHGTSVDDIFRSIDHLAELASD